MSLNLNRIETEILKSWPAELTGHYCIGLSGGCDSVVLLHLIASLAKKRQITLTALHVNHGLSQQALNWEQHCQSLCDNLSIPLRISRLSVVKHPGMGLENSARIARYAEFSTSSAAVMILAHHEDDLIETMLSQAMRGSNLHNLAGMRTLTRRQQQYYWRPLLPYSKQDLIEYAAHYQLKYIEDESNLDPQYLRNFLRLQIIPQLLAYDKQVPTKLIKSIHSLQEACTLVDELALLDLKYCQNSSPSAIESANIAPVKVNSDAYTTDTYPASAEKDASATAKLPLYIPNLLDLSYLRQVNTLNCWLKAQAMPLPTQKHLAEFLRQVAEAKTGTTQQLILGGRATRPIPGTLAQDALPTSYSHLLRKKQHIYLIKSC